jgi:cellobiose phosphorylase
MKRRDFLRATALSGGAWVSLEGNQSAVERSVRKTSLPHLDKSAYYEFSPDNKECVIQRHDTPVPWMNLLGNDRFVAWVCHNGSIVESCLVDNATNRLTNAQSGYFYIRDADKGEYFLLNKPRKGSPWQSVQGLGYTRITTTDLELTVTGTYFVPRDEDVLIWLVTIKNNASRSRNLDTFGLVEWCLGDPYRFTVLPGGDFLGLMNNFKRVQFRDGALYANNEAWGTLGQFMGQKAWPYTGFFASSLPVKSFDCDRALFLGPTDGFDNPRAVRKGKCSSKPAFGFSDFPLGVLQNSLDLAANETRTLVLILGIIRERPDAERIQEKYENPGRAEEALGKVKGFWDKYIESSFIVATPDRDNDRLINVWIKYQHRASMLQNLNTGRRGSGVWAPAYGYGGGRISDIREVGNVPCDLELIKEDILDYLEWPRPLLLESDVDLKWNPPARPAPPMPYPHDGRGLWPYPVCWYVEETGDFSFLETELHPKSTHPWMPKTGPKTVFAAMKGAVDWAQSGLSERGLPRLDPGYGDWNDALSLISREGKGESILTAMEICYMLKQCTELAKVWGKSLEAEAWTKQYEHIKSAVNTYAWDGEWYLRAFTDEGNPVGGSRCAEGKIYLEVQALAVLSGVADEERAAKCLKSVDDLLLTELGPRLSAPYTKPAYDVGLVADFGPGWRENGGIWNRTTGWTVMANCLANRANQAYEMYRRASVSNASKDIERFWLPPYVYPEYYVGDGPDFGRGQFQWCMGKAGTMWRAYVYYILGVRPVFTGLLVEPKIPNEWAGFRLRRTFRGATYAIEVANPEGVNFGVKSMVVDGEPIEGNVVPAYADGKTHEVKVVLGA